MNEQVLQKLKVLAESAKYDVSCASSEEWETPSADGASAIASPKTDDASPC